jgi:hypothetical protein
VRTSGFADHFNTIALECGSSRYQATLDRYTNGEDVSYEQISQVWRDTTKAVGWESPLYADLLATIRGRQPGIAVSAADSRAGRRCAH